MKLDDRDFAFLNSRDSLSFCVDNYARCGLKNDYEQNIGLMTEELIKLKIHNDLDGIFGEYGENWDDVLSLNGYDFVEDYINNIGASYNYGKAQNYENLIENIVKSNVYDFDYIVSEIVESKKLDNTYIGNDIML